MKTQLVSQLLEAGCDEAGRGCLAGPVVAAAVILNEKIAVPEFIRDSKQLNTAEKNEARKWIEKYALDYAIASVSNEEIDTINILNASILAMQNAVLQLKMKPEHIVIDGNRFKPLLGYQYTTVIKGDSKLKNIAAASILAKTERDKIMQDLNAIYPNYHWNQNNGYPTKQHKQAIQLYGVTPHHRLTFKGVLNLEV